MIKNGEDNRLIYKREAVLPSAVFIFDDIIIFILHMFCIFLFHILIS